MSSKVKRRPTKKAPSKRTPRTFMVDEERKQFPSVIPEPFNLKNFDVVGKIDDMRSLTKELSVMARQLEQWMGVIYTVSMAFKDNGIMKDVLRSLSTLGDGNSRQAPQAPQVERERPKGNQKRAPFPPPFPFLGETEEEDDDAGEEYTNQGAGNPMNGMNIMDVIGNPAFQEIISKLFLQNKK